MLIFEKHKNKLQEIITKMWKCVVTIFLFLGHTVCLNFKFKIHLSTATVKWAQLTVNLIFYVYNLLLECYFFKLFVAIFVLLSKINLVVLLSRK